MQSRDCIALLLLIFAISASKILDVHYRRPCIRNSDCEEHHVCISSQCDLPDFYDQGRASLGVINESHYCGKDGKVYSFSSYANTTGKECGGDRDCISNEQCFRGRCREKERETYVTVLVTIACSHDRDCKRYYKHAVCEKKQHCGLPDEKFVKPIYSCQVPSDCPSSHRCIQEACWPDTIVITTTVGCKRDKDCYNGWCNNHVCRSSSKPVKKFTGCTDHRDCFFGQVCTAREMCVEVEKTLMIITRKRACNRNSICERIFGSESYCYYRKHCALKTDTVIRATYGCKLSSDCRTYELCVARECWPVDSVSIINRKHGCKRNGDCYKSKCIAGECVSYVELPKFEGCKTERDCHEGEMCIHARCINVRDVGKVVKQQMACRNDSFCQEIGGAYDYCQNKQFCTGLYGTVENPKWGCETTSNCPDRHTCINNECWRSSSVIDIDLNRHGCRTNDDCYASRCVDGICKSTTTPKIKFNNKKLDGCAGDNDCVFGYVCVQQDCVEKRKTFEIAKQRIPCEDDLACQTVGSITDICYKNQFCISAKGAPVGEVRSGCQISSDCLGFERCVNGECWSEREVIRVSKKKGCKKDSHCYKSQCVHGQCIPRTVLPFHRGCKSTRECPYGTFCVHGKCLSDSIVVIIPYIACQRSDTCRKYLLTAYCHEGKHCMPGGSNQVSAAYYCTRSSQCPEEQVCVYNECWRTSYVPRVPSNFKCLDRWACYNASCISGVCQRKTPPTKRWTGCKSTLDCSMSHVCLKDECVLKKSVGQLIKQHIPCEDDQKCREVGSETDYCYNKTYCHPESNYPAFEYGCSKASDCPDFMDCVHGECWYNDSWVYVDLTKYGCIHQSDCTGNAKCENRVCISKSKLPRPDVSFTCTTNRQCGAGKVCVKRNGQSTGLCMTGIAGGVCTEDSDCSSDNSCIMGKCTASQYVAYSILNFYSCIEDTECRVLGKATDFCFNKTHCVPADGVTYYQPRFYCENAAACPLGHICYAHECWRHEYAFRFNIETKPCWDDSNCHNSKCYSSICIPDYPMKTTIFRGCTDDNDCAYNQKCIAGRCRHGTEVYTVSAFAITCRTNADCAQFSKAFACEARHCSPHIKLPNVPMYECSFNSDCPSANLCVDSVCWPTSYIAHVDIDCREKNYCSKNARCVNGVCVIKYPQLTAYEGCQNDQQCKSTEQCLHRRCVRSEFVITVIKRYIRCDSDKYCWRIGERTDYCCESKYCVPRGEKPTSKTFRCEFDSDCAPNHLCRMRECWLPQYLGFFDASVEGVCKKNSDCIDAYCTSDGNCVPLRLAPENPNSCEFDRDCAKKFGGGRCVTRHCVPEEYAGIAIKYYKACRSNNDCRRIGDLNDYCYRRSCRSRFSAVRDIYYCDRTSGCPPGAKCIFNECWSKTQIYYYDMRIGACKENADCVRSFCLYGNCFPSKKKRRRYRAGCKNTAECKPDHECVEGNCIISRYSANCVKYYHSCQSDEDCQRIGGPTDFCFNKKHCATNQIANLRGLQKCDSDRDCPPYFFCYTSECWSLESRCRFDVTKGECKSNADCSSARCINQRCIPYESGVIPVKKCRNLEECFLLGCAYGKCKPCPADCFPCISGNPILIPAIRPCCKINCWPPATPIVDVLPPQPGEPIIPHIKCYEPRDCCIQSRCKTAYMCFNHLCTSVELPTRTEPPRDMERCRRNGDCIAPMKCYRSHCTLTVTVVPRYYRCKNDNQCRHLFTKNHFCHKRFCISHNARQTEPHFRCSSARECAPKWLCIFNQCMHPNDVAIVSAWKLTCQHSGNCMNAHCIQGVCYPAELAEKYYPSCDSDDDCDYLCRNGKCISHIEDHFVACNEEGSCPSGFRCVADRCFKLQAIKFDVIDHRRCISGCERYGSNIQCHEESHCLPENSEPYLSIYRCDSFEAKCPYGTVCVSGECFQRSHVIYVVPSLGYRGNACIKNSDCFKSVCLMGVCTPRTLPPNEYKPCESDRSCRNNKKCVQGVCINKADVSYGIVQYMACRSHQDCIRLTNDVSTFCYRGLMCLPDGAPAEDSMCACSTDNDCQESRTCHMKKCWPERSVFKFIRTIGVCETNDECSEYAVCIKNNCIPKRAAGQKCKSCTADDVCPFGEECVNGECKKAIGFTDSSFERPEQCITDYECPLGYRCHNSICLPPLAPLCASGCPPPSICGPHGICMMKAVCNRGKRCRTSRDCKKDQFCSLSTCCDAISVESHDYTNVTVIPNRWCDGRMKCAQNYVCHKNWCVHVKTETISPLRDCKSDLQCPNGTMCYMRKCQFYDVQPVPPPRPVCLSSDDCKYNMICSRGYCLNIPPKKPDGMQQSCVQHADCSDGYVCYEEFCHRVPPVEGPSNGRGGCTVNDDCARDSFCYNHNCLVRFSGTSSKKRKKCKKDNDCNIEHICLKGACIKLVESPQELPEEENLKDKRCSGDGDCSNEEVCMGERCRKKPTERRCTSNSNCNSGRICHNGSCVRIPAITFDWCTYDTDCFYGDVCVKGVCIGIAVPKKGICYKLRRKNCAKQRFTEYIECGSRIICDSCLNAMSPKCKFDNDCPPRFVCYRDHCSGPIIRPRPPTSKECKIDNDCLLNHVCHHRHCIPLPEDTGFGCVRDDQCARNYFCHNRICIRLRTPSFERGTTCTTDADCHRTQICHLGVCVRLSTPECTENSDCPYGKCYRNKCINVNNCLTDDECPVGYDCSGEECVPRNQKTACSNDNQCDHGFFCSRGYCLRRQGREGIYPEVERKCISEWDCPQGFACIGDYCIQITIKCNSQRDCHDGFTCDTTTQTCRKKGMVTAINQTTQITRTQEWQGKCLKCSYPHVCFKNRCVHYRLIEQAVKKYMRCRNDAECRRFGDPTDFCNVDHCMPDGGMMTHAKFTCSRTKECPPKHECIFRECWMTKYIFSYLISNPACFSTDACYESHCVGGACQPDRVPTKTWFVLHQCGRKKFDPTPLPCQSTEYCATGQLCIKGKCETMECNRQCCPFGEKCVAYKCVPAAKVAWLIKVYQSCKEDDYCMDIGDSTDYCYNHTHCMPRYGRRTFAKYGCQDSRDCPSGHQCVKGECWALIYLAEYDKRVGACHSDDDCYQAKCISNICVPVRPAITVYRQCELISFLSFFVTSLRYQKDLRWFSPVSSRTKPCRSDFHVHIT